MKWIKASERLPTIPDDYFVKIRTLKPSTEMDIIEIGNTFEWEPLDMREYGDGDYVYEWLDETPNPEGESIEEVNSFEKRQAALKADQGNGIYRDKLAIPTKPEEAGKEVREPLYYPPYLHQPVEAESSSMKWVRVYFAAEAQIKSLEAERDALKKEVAALKEEVRLADSIIAELQPENIALQAQIITNNGHVRYWKGQAEQLKQQLSDLNRWEWPNDQQVKPTK